MNGGEKEALRQQLLLSAVLGDAPPGAVADWMGDGLRAAAGLQAYRANAAATAARALAAVYPTIQALISEDSFAALARDFWRHHPPVAGDLGLWGDELPRFMADAASLASEPYLADVARLEWAVHVAERAADVRPAIGLQALADEDAGACLLRLAPGTAFVASVHPIVTLWQAHRSQEPARYEPVRAAFAAQRAETALVSRRGWRAEVRALAPEEARFIQALLGGWTLGAALDAAGPAFDFQAWLIAALQQPLLAAVCGPDDRQGEEPA